MSLLRREIMDIHSRPPPSPPSPPNPPTKNTDVPSFTYEFLDHLVLGHKPFLDDMPSVSTEFNAPRRQAKDRTRICSCWPIEHAGAGGGRS